MKMEEGKKNEETFSTKFTAAVTAEIKKYNEKMEWLDSQPENAMTDQEKANKQIVWVRDVKYVTQDFENQLTNN